MPERGDIDLFYCYAGENVTAMCSFYVMYALVGTNKGRVYVCDVYPGPVVALEGEIITALCATDHAIYIGTNKGMIYEQMIMEDTMSVLANLNREVLSMMIMGADTEWAPFLSVGVEGGNVYAVAIEDW